MTTTERSELQRLADLHRLCADVQKQHKARMTPKGKRRRVSRGTDRRRK